LETRLSSVQSCVGFHFIKETLYHQNKESHSTQWIARIRVTQIARRNTITHKFIIYRYNTSTSEMILAKHMFPPRLFKSKLPSTENTSSLHFPCDHKPMSWCTAALGWTIRWTEQMEPQITTSIQPTDFERWEPLGY